jgi:hypothetical protein
MEESGPSFDVKIKEEFVLISDVKICRVER